MEPHKDYTILFRALRSTAGEFRGVKDSEHSTWMLFCSLTGFEITGTDRAESAVLMRTSHPGSHKVKRIYRRGDEILVEVE